MPEQDYTLDPDQTMIRLSGSITKVNALAEFLLPFINTIVIKDKTYPARRPGWINRYITISIKDETK